GPLTERVKEQLAEIAARSFLPLLPATLAEKYELAYYDKLRHSEKKRRAMEFLRNWEANAAIAKERGRAWTGSKLLASLKPLVDALEKRDAQFFKGLAEAMQILEQREISNKTKYPG